jgi:hypothetical protein
MMKTNLSQPATYKIPTKNDLSGIQYAQLMQTESESMVALRRHSDERLIS